MIFYKCNLCGNFITFLTDKVAGKPVCCGEEMKEIVANTVDAAKEKHVPVVEIEGNKVSVKVGSVEHPMQPEHFIQFIIVETTNGYQKKNLNPGEKPEAEFLLVEGEKPVAVYEYCNLHGLWKTEI